MPCYNEEAGIGYTANTLRAFSDGMKDRYDVTFLFVDDGSRDKTWDRLNALFGARADCQLLRHAENRGVAATVLTGIRHARTEIVAVIDCDGTYDPLQLRALIPLLGPGVDMVTASPYHPEGEVLNLPRLSPRPLERTVPPLPPRPQEQARHLYRMLPRLS